MDKSHFSSETDQRVARLYGLDSAFRSAPICQNVIDYNNQRSCGRKAMKLRTAATTLALIWSAGANAQDMKAEVIHWWTSGGESAAVKVFADQFTKAGGAWIDNAIAGGVSARAVAINRTIGGNPPTAMQFNTGKQVDDLVEGNLLSDVEAGANENTMGTIMPQEVLQANARHGK